MTIATANYIKSKTKKHNKYIYLLIVMLLLASPAFAGGDIFSASLKKRLYSDEKIISLNRWSTKYGDLLCIYSRPDTYVMSSDVEEQNLQHFVCYRQSKGDLVVSFKQDVITLIVGVVQFHDDRLDVTVPCGTTDCTYTLSFDGKKVSVYLDGSVPKEKAW